MEFRQLTDHILLSAAANKRKITRQTFSQLPAGQLSLGSQAQRPFLTITLHITL